MQPDAIAAGRTSRGHVVCLTPNPAVDVTYRVATLTRGATHRVGEVLQRPGGKGVNVARVLKTLGHEAVVVMPVGGPTGAWLVDQLGTAGVGASPVPVAAETRRTVTVVDASGSATALNEPGRPLSDDEWASLTATVTQALDDAAALVISGSFPAGTPSDLPARLVTLAHHAGVPAVVDTSGRELLTAAGAGPELVKPNVDELTDATGIAAERPVDRRAPSGAELQKSRPALRAGAILPVC